MALDPKYFVTEDITSYFVNKDTGLPLASGIITFYQDSARTVLQPVFQLTGAPPYNEDSYVQLPNPLILSNVGTYEDASSNPVIIYYYPYNSVTGDLSLYYIVVTDSGGNEQFTVSAWPNSAVSSGPTPATEQPPNNSSFLVGWDFPLNPYQFGANSSATPAPPAPGPITTIPGYIIDQTIAASVTSSVSWTSDTVTGTNGLAFNPSGTNDSFYILQYLSGDTVNKMVGTTMSVNVNGYVVGASSPVTMQIYLFRAPSTAVIPTLPATIGTISSNGTFTLTASGWNAIPRSGSPIPNVTLSSVLVPTDVNNVANNYGFNGYQITNDTDLENTNLFAMVVTFAYSSASTNITVNSISLVPGDVPSLPDLLTPDDTLLQCQYYYQKSFIGSQVPVFHLGADTGETNGVQAAPSGTLCGGPTIVFKTTMRASPNITLYAPISNSPYKISNSTSTLPWTNSSPAIVGNSPQGFQTQGTTVTLTSSPGNICSVHWTADARLAVV